MKRDMFFSRQGVSKVNDIQSRQEILKNLKLFSKMKHKLLNQKNKLKVKDREELTRDFGKVKQANKCRKVPTSV